MKQVLLSPSNGDIEVVDVPAPVVESRSVFVRSSVSIISPGTERMLVGLAAKGPIGKARARPEAARQVVDAVRREGLRAAYWKAQARLGHPFPLGYSVAGTVLELGHDLLEPKPGTRVACGGAGRAVHAEFVSVSQMLAIPVPDGVGETEAALANIGAVALHAIRIAGADPGGSVAIVGLGLLGQLAAQLVSAVGVACIGVDPFTWRREKAASLAGCAIAESVGEATGWCEARGGVDAVIVAAASDSADLLDPTIGLLRDRGRIVVLGSVPVVVDRDGMYRKEASLVVARSSGAGRYEPSYEEGGVDLPPGHVRWTEGRNIAAFMDLTSRGTLALNDLVTHRFSIDEAPSAYELVDRAEEDVLGVALDYSSQGVTPSRHVTMASKRAVKIDQPRVGVIGAGAFARSVLLPNLKLLPVTLSAVATASGASATGSAKRFGFPVATTDLEEVINSPEIDAVVIATRHGSHARLAAEALAAGKHVYVEKPLALTREQLSLAIRASLESHGILSVGFNRRFAPIAHYLKGQMRGNGQITMSYVVNVAPFPADSWILDPEDGGGVVSAEGGHFIDTMTWLAGHLPVQVFARTLDSDSYVTIIEFEDGSSGTLTYTTGAAGRGPKERLIVGGRSLFADLDDFRRLTMWPDGRRTIKKGRQDKGHAASLRAWVEAIREGKKQPVPTEEIAAVSEATICVGQSMQLGTAIKVASEGFRNIGGIDRG